MSASIEAKGSCLCGAVTMQAQSMDTEVGACHCSTCRKWTGGPVFAVDCTSDVSISGEESITIFDSSEWAERGFCAKCGTHLFYRLKANNQYFVPVGFFDVDEGVHLGHQIFIDEKPDYYAFANKTKNMTGAEVFAAFTGEQT